MTLTRAGAKLEDATHLLKTATIPGHVKVIVLAIGVNNAKEDLATITGRITTLQSAAAAAIGPKKLRILFTEVPQHPNALLAQSRAVNHLNQTARDIAGQSFVDLPVDLVVTPSTMSRYNTVHYDRSTADQIIRHLRQVVSHLN